MLKKAILGTGALALAGAIETAYFYRRTMIRQNAKLERTMKMAGTDWSQYGELLAKRKELRIFLPVFRKSLMLTMGRLLCINESINAKFGK